MPDVVLPVLDEVAAIPWVLDRMPGGYRPIIVDNGSTDGSGALARRLGALVVDEPGFGAASWAGLVAAEADIVCFADCDGSLDLGHLPEVAGPVERSEADLVLGRRGGCARAPARQGNAWCGNRVPRTMATSMELRGTERPLVPLIDAASAPLLARPLFSDGDPGPIVGALAQVPEVLKVALPFLGTVLGPSSIPWRTKEIVILRTSALLACRYCVDAHTPVARDAGLSIEEVEALRTSAVSEVADVFTDPSERSLLRWIDAVAAGGPGAVPDGPADAVVEATEVHELVELTLLIGTTMMLNRFCTALRLPTSVETLSRLVAEGWA